MVGLQSGRPGGGCSGALISSESPPLRRYKFINDFTVPRNFVDQGGGWRNVTPEDIVACQRGDGSVPGGLRPEDIIVQNQKIDFAMNGRAK